MLSPQGQTARVEYRQQHTREWAQHFARAGHPDVRPLAAGVEGAVYLLGDGTVAKVWGRRRAADLLPWQAFYADVAAAGLPFATPEIHSVEEVGGVAVTIERELPGVPLGPSVTPEAAGAVTGVLAALATVPGTAAMRALPVLDETTPLRDGDFVTSLAALLERRTAGAADLLRSRVPGFDDTYAAVRAGLAALDRRPDTVVHGDLFGENVLVDDAGRATAVLDFGFLSTAGDPRFDAAVTAGIMDMYGPGAAATTDALTDRFAAGLGHDPGVLRLYRAAYAIATCTAFADDGSDGHFGWCVRQLTTG
jgi:aminoglycoside phosphotransferase (APT) family kinase protein